MKILHIVPALESGGVETGTVDLALSLKKLGEEVTVISNGGRLAKELEDNGITHIKLPVHSKSPLSFSMIPKVASVIKSNKIDVVHASSRVPAWIGFLACKLTKTPFVTSCHGFYSDNFTSRVMGWGDLVMVISKTVGKRMTEDFGVPEEKIRLIHRGVNLAKYRYDADKYDMEKGFYKVINIGRITPIKGQYEFIKAMKRVSGRIENVESWIVGGTEKGKENYLKSLESLVGELELEGKVRFLGFRSDIQDLLLKADCLVLSSNVPEGFGRAVIEAGAVGTAVCASAAGGIQEIINDGFTGLLFPPGDTEKMADAIIKLLSDRALRKQCSQNLRRKVEENFTLERMTRQTLAVYHEAIDKK